ncbi:MAG: endonuclease/exonuclease/phosphatase family protein [Anaerolineales bacterium]|nr:endonuclease/exonuclease/phosphatase family protein [Anaerolineales bacterium]
MQLRRDLLRSVEAGIMGLFLIQSIRFLYATFYAHISSADLVRRVINNDHLLSQPGYIEPLTVQREVLAIGIALLAPLLALILSRTVWSIPLAVALGVVGRSMALQVPDSAGIAAALVVGAGLLYMTLMIIRRPNHFPAMLLIGIALDQLIRASNNSFDMSWEPAYQFQLMGQTFRNDTAFWGVTVFMVLLTGYVTLLDLEISRVLPEPERRGMLTGWGSLALGSFFFLELTLLGLANVVARWAHADYTDAVPWLLLATILPLVPIVRDQARIFLGAFDGVWRGWLWTLLLGLLIVLGSRFDGTLSLVVLVMAQFVASLTLWWMIKLRDPNKERTLPNPTPILALIALIIFGGLSVGDYFTYDYAYVRDFAAPFASVDGLLRSLEGWGLQLFLLASLIVCMPIILERRVIPWHSGRKVESFFTVVLTVAVSLGSIQMALPPRIQGPSDINCLRIGSLNLHSGYTLLFDNNLENAADTIRFNGVDVVLLQEVDTGRLSSFGVDQVEWLARELQMESAFFAQNETLQGLAILSRVPIRSVSGEKLTSTGPQAGVIHVELGLDAEEFHVYNVWLAFETADASGLPLPSELQDQVIQTRELEQLIAQNHSPDFTDRIILGGTFNYDRNSSLYSYWDQETTFVDPFRNLAIERAKTIFLADNTSARFDYIWLMNVEPTGVNIDLDHVVSDHRLIVAGVSRTPDQVCR